ncbi:copper chaperone PCu(A)C [Pseudomonas auratipiscis]|uniref:Copper chaperone PCu(A)C n=1 Tax=Pseudomonas auratipiscis TaxID=3115853 RepID=A0AB35WW01_9PSED|nr:MULTISPECIES: copper chaperone PCu(A)C [unclassified Pseudomonas]MEE1868612.1 copper chaperone PCu(A)C [Pseudomonas sp. 120P]MEE1959273.1 copper chaperone PCu(A)C [Pseudomonas sp. 119P]
MVARLLVFAALLASSTLSVAHDYQVGELLIKSPWSRELPVDLPGGSAYFSIDNLGSESDRLISVSSPRAQKTSLHAQASSDGMMNMQHMTTMEIPAHSQTIFKPGANHVMLSGMEQPLKAGEQFPLTLEFEKAGKVEVQVDVRPADEQTGHVH